MRSVVVRAAGSYEQLRIEESRDPVPAVGQVVVRTEAIGVNYADCIVRMGYYSSARELVGFPITPGFECAGRVERVGVGVTRVREGDRVMAATLFGGYASHVLVPEHQVFPIPDGFTASEAAAFPSVFLTAHYALFELANVRRPASLLVHSAAGGVGSALVQLGKRARCRVVGVVGRSDKVDEARALGCDVVIDKSRQDLWTRARAEEPRGYDVVLDANGVETLRQSYLHLGSPGRLVVYGFHTMLPRSGGRPSLPRLAVDFLRTPRFDPLEMTQQNRSVLAFNLSYLFERREVLDEAIADLLAAVRAKQVRAPHVTEFPLDRVADAHRAIESGRTVGKLVLVP